MTVLKHIRFCVFKYEYLNITINGLNLNRTPLVDINNIPKGWNGPVEVEIELSLDKNFYYIKKHAIAINTKIEYERADYSDILYKLL